MEQSPSDKTRVQTKETKKYNTEHTRKPGVEEWISLQKKKKEKKKEKRWELVLRATAQRQSYLVERACCYDQHPHGADRAGTDGHKARGDSK